MEPTPNVQQEVEIRQSYTPEQFFAQIHSGVTSDLEKGLIPIPKGINDRPYFWEGERITDYTRQLLIDRHTAQAIVSHARKVSTPEQLQIHIDALNISLANADDGEQYKQQNETKISSFPRTLGLDVRSIWKNMCSAFTIIDFEDASDPEPLLESYGALLHPDNPSPGQNNLATSFRLNAKSLYTDIPTKSPAQEKAKILLFSGMTNRDALPEDVWGSWGIVNFSSKTSGMLTQAVHERFVVQDKDSLHLGTRNLEITLRMYCTELFRKVSKDPRRALANVEIINKKLNIYRGLEQMALIKDVIGLANTFTNLLNNKADGLPDRRGVMKRHPLLSAENYQDLGEAMRRLLFMTRIPQHDKGEQTREDMLHVDIIAKVCEQRQKIIGKKVGRIATN